MGATLASLASGFLAALGIGAPLHYTDGQYADIRGVLADLDYIGIHHVRTAAYHTRMQGQSSFHRAAQNGVRFDMLLNTTDDLPARIAQLAGFAAQHPGAVVAIEGPNEINNFGASYHGMKGAPAAIAFQNDLYAAVAANRVLRGIPVFSYTMNAGASSSTGYDSAAIHPYPVGGRPPQRMLDINLASVPAGKPVVVTETGYSTLPEDKDGVDARAQAIYAFDMILDARAAGAQAIYLYELRDAYPDPGGRDLVRHFGVFDHANQPKPLATGLHNLTHILSWQANADAPGSLDFAAAGPGRTLPLQKRAGLFDIMVWNEAPVWSAARRAPADPPPAARTIRFGGAHHRISLFDPLRGTTAMATWHDVAEINLPYGPDPLIIEVES